MIARTLLLAITALSLGGAAYAQSSGSSSSSTGSTGSAGTSTGTSTSPSTTTSPGATSPSVSNPSNMNPLTPRGPLPLEGPNAQGNTFAPGTVGQRPAANPANPQDRTTQPNPQDLNSATGRNPQDLGGLPRTPSIIKPEQR
jgi:hypothetical protein